MHCRLYMACGAASLVLGASLLPVWTVWSFGPREGLGQLETLWAVPASVPRNARELGWLGATVGLHLETSVAVVLLAAVGAYLGLGVHDARARRSRLKAGLCACCG